MAQDKNKTIPNVPPLRFPGFTDDWKEKTIGDVTSIGSGRDYKHLDAGDIPVFGTGGYMLSVNDYLYEGETVFIGRKGTIDKPFWYSGKFWTVDTLFYTFDFKGVLPKFIYNQFLRINWKLYNEASGVPSLSKATIEKIKIKYPSLAEQEKISSFLSLVDERINIQNKIIEDLKKLRAAIIDKEFNSMNGKIFLLEEVADIIKGKQINGEYLTDDGEYYVMNGGVEPSGYYHSFNALGNTISISEGGNSCGYIQWNNKPFWSGGHCYTLNIKDDFIENKYLYHFLKWREVDIMKLRIGSGLPNIQKKDLAKVPIIIPSNSAQKGLIDLADSIDGKIEIENTFLTLLHSQKGYLLSRLFI